MSSPTPWMREPGWKTGKTAQEYKDAWNRLGQLNADMYGDGKYDASKDTSWQRYYDGPAQDAAVDFRAPPQADKAKAPAADYSSYSPGQQGNQGGSQAYAKSLGMMVPNPGESQQQFDTRVNQHIQGMKDRGSNPAWYGFGPENDTGKQMGGGPYSAYRPGQAQPRARPDATATQYGAYQTPHTSGQWSFTPGTSPFDQPRQEPSGQADGNWANFATQNRPAAFTARYGNFQGGFSGAPQAGMRDAFIQSVNNQTGQGQYNVDTSAAWNSAQQMAEGGFNNPFAQPPTPAGGQQPGGMGNQRFQDLFQQFNFQPPAGFMDALIARLRGGSSPNGPFRQA